MYKLIQKLFDTSDFPARWHCGHWTSLHGWVHIVSDLAVWGAYAAIPATLYYFISKKKDVPFHYIFVLFCLFILSCGTVHLVEATIFWHPWYRLSALIKFITAIVSWLTVFALIQVIPKALDLKSPNELEKTVKLRTEELTSANKVLKEEMNRRKVAEEEKGRLAALVNSSDDAIVSKDLNGNIMSWNLGAEKIFGYTPEEVIGKSITMLIPEEFLFEEEQILTKIKAGVHIETYETKRKKKDGTIFDVSITVSPILDNNGKIIGASKISRDITQRKHLEEELKESNERLVESNKELEMFAYVASHDLQEPLRMVASYTKLLEEKYKDKIDEKANKYINFAVGGAATMQELINNLLDYSKVGTEVKNLTLVDCNQILEQAILNIKKIKELGISVNYSNLPKVTYDKTQLMQVFQNLIGNSVKYKSEEPLKINIDARRENKFWLFSVADNGIGFEKEHSHRIFELFQRLHSKKQYEGTGMGLAICKRIIERNGGKIWADSKPGKGSTFYFTIPA